MKVNLLLMVTLSLQSCFVQKSYQKRELTTIKLVSVLPFIRQVNKQPVLLTDVDSTYMSFYKKFAICHIPTFFREQVGDSLKIKNTIWRHLFFKIGADTCGLLFDNDGSSISGFYKVDSILKANFFKNDELYMNHNDSLFFEKKKGSHYIKGFITKVKYDNTYPDTSYLYYSKKLVDIPYTSFSQIDNLKNYKLQKIEFVYNSLQEHPHVKNDTTSFRATLSFEISKDLAKQKELFRLLKLPKIYNLLKTQ